MRGVVLRKSDRKVHAKFDHPGNKLYVFYPPEKPEDFIIMTEDILDRPINEIPVESHVDENGKVTPYEPETVDWPAEYSKAGTLEDKVKVIARYLGLAE